MKCTFALLVLFAAAAPSVALASTWPTLAHPRDAHIEPIGERVRVNGVPMRLTRVITALPADAAAAHYQRALGAPVASSQTGHTQVLAKARGDLFITVSIAPLPDGRSEVLTAVADSRAAREGAGRPLGLTLPAGSELLSDMESIDGGLASRQLVLINPHSLRTNLDRLSASLADRGLRPDGPPLANDDDALAQAFSGAAGEAQLVLVRRDGTTSAVLTLLSRQP
ncbi:hypothetical protein [Thauera sp.]|jgi:hypothetical protein|uniref:hypothetical protein n=1 Tax=Thauera sp. TaxID=1905334 RepID=UPI002A36277E|nr:hypothetical protein [Thauera sp.]MDX9886889.1 hypothetical protein [Thauera sp.]